MDTLELMTDLAARGFRLSADGDRLLLHGRIGKVTDTLKAQLREHKPAILALLRDGLVTCAVCGAWPPEQYLPDGTARCSVHQVDKRTLPATVADVLADNRLATPNDAPVRPGDTIEIAGGMGQHLVWLTLERGVVTATGLVVSWDAIART